MFFFCKFIADLDGTDDLFFVPDNEIAFPIHGKVKNFTSPPFKFDNCSFDSILITN